MASKYFSEKTLISILKSKRFSLDLLKQTLAYLTSEETRKKNDKEFSDLLESVKTGDTTAMRFAIEKMASKLLHLNLDIRNVKNVKLICDITLHSAREISIKVKFPTKSIIPQSIEIPLKSNKVLYKPKPEKQINKEYLDLITKLSLKTIHTVLVTLPTVEKIYFCGYIDTIHPMKGYQYEACIISFVVDVDEYDHIVIENLGAEAILSNFQLRFRYDHNFEISETIPHIHGKVNDVTSLIDLDNINPLVFEDLIKSLLNKMGLIAETTKASYDGGIDVVAVSQNPITGGRFVVQCKRYNKVIPVDVIRDLYGAMTHERASKGILITTADFSTECIKFAQGKPIELINRRLLIQLLNEQGYKISEKI